MRVRSFWTAVALCLFAAACDSGTPQYVRVSGPAPQLPPTKTRAQLVVFWAAWCAPCVEETPDLERLADALPKDLTLLTFSQDSNTDVITRVLGKPPHPGLNLRLDPASRVANKFGVETLPTSVLVVDGQRVAEFNGPRRWGSGGMKKLLEKLITEPALQP